MCWKTRNVERTEKKISPESGVRVFKIVNISPCGSLYAPYHGDFEYKLGKVACHTDEISIYSHMGAFFAREGLHSYLSDSVFVKTGNHGAYYVWTHLRYLNYFFDKLEWGDSSIVMEGIIPPGTPYYVNEYGEVISEQLLPTNVVELADYSVHVTDYMRTEF